MKNHKQILPPGSVIGVFGGGQLARMLGIAAAQTGYKFIIFDPHPTPPAAQVANIHIQGEFSDKDLLEKFLNLVDIVTLEFENLPINVAKFAEIYKPLKPKSNILEITQNRLLEKNFCKQLDIAVTDFLPVNNLDEFKQAYLKLGPGIIKTVKDGYDGKGQYKINKIEDIYNIDLKNVEWIYEKFVDFNMEISIIIACNELECLTYPIVQNIHENGILRKTIAPAVISSEISLNANEYAKKIAKSFGLNGLIAIEFFLLENGKILVNEIAPRPHNSGHWTIDGAITDQFRQTINAITNLPLTSTDIVAPCTMINLIGSEIENIYDFYKNPKAKVHLYGKDEIRNGRKMGHVTIIN